MRKLATELGVNPMAVYHHLPNKAALFDGVVEAVYHEFTTAVGALSWEGAAWRERLAGLMNVFRDTLRRHPHVLVVVATRPSYTPSVLAFGDRMIELLHEPGLTEHNLLIMISATRSYTIGQLLAEIGEPVGGPTPQMAPLDGRYPHLVKAVAGGYSPDAHYEWVLQSMLDGFERRLDESRSAVPAPVDPPR
jgi:AcrR family transcriptional regulator